MTNMCVSSTARAALDLGYKATVAADAAATRDLPDPMGASSPPTRCTAPRSRSWATASPS